MTPKAAVSALRRLPLFERVSLRLLHDLIEFASLEWWWDDPEAQAIDQAPFRRTKMLQSTLPGGTIAERRFQTKWLEEALAASFTLARALHERHAELSLLLPPNEQVQKPPPPRVHWLLLTKDERFADPRRGGSDLDVSAAAGLLARALARTTADLDEAAAVATFDDAGITLQRWNADGPGPVVQVPLARFKPPDAAHATLREFPPSIVTDASKRLGGTDATAWHVVCVVPAAPQSLPAWWRERFRREAFHRLVYLTRPGRPLQPPSPLLGFLLRGAWNPRWRDGPYFSSVIPTIVLDESEAGRGRPVWPRPGRDLPTLEVSPWEEGAETGAGRETRPIAVRLRRDLCRIRLRLNRLATCDAEPAIAASLDRWARAVTNRQVGLALSGGGATSAALVPFLEDLRRYGVPADVVGGFSGGAILGLYVATSRMSSYYDLPHRLGLSVLVPAGMFWSKFTEVALNAEFRGACLEDLDVRFVPMTVELRGDGSPRACAVVGGTVGEGVRVSGIGLGLYAPAERRGTRYVDGGVAMGVPAAVLPDFGADMVIACNSVVPPNGRDLNAILPFDIGSYLRWHPLCTALVERAGDSFVGWLTALRESARVGAEDADVYYEVSPDVTPFLQAFFWSRLDRIRADAAAARGWEEALDRSLEHWRLLRGQGAA
jgi:hypothetical protein